MQTFEDLNHDERQSEKIKGVSTEVGSNLLDATPKSSKPHTETMERRN